MGGAEKALMLKIHVCWLKWADSERESEGEKRKRAAFGADITSEIGSQKHST